MKTPTLPKGVRSIMARLAEKGHRADIVGGCVRDFLLGKSPYDYDVTTDATPDEMLDIFRDFRTIPTGIKHGTVTVVADGVPYEVTSYRRDGDYRDHRHPDSVTFTQALSEDLARRDFTMNAIAYNPNDGFTDLYGGMGDIENKLIRAVGDPNRRFEEDALRILRAIRFSATLGFRIERETASAAAEKSSLLSYVSGERIYAEWKKLIAGKDAHRVLLDHRDVVCAALGLKNYTLPDKARFDAAEMYTRFVSIFAGLSEPIEAFSSVCSRLRVDNAISHLGTTALTNLTRPLERDVDIKLCLHDIGQEDTVFLASLGVLLGSLDENVHTKIKEILISCAPYSVCHLAVNGRDVMQLGFKGSDIGGVLEFLITSVIKGDIVNEREMLINSAKLYTPYS